MIDPTNDPSPEQLARLAQGIYSQGGKLVEFNSEIVNKKVNYILIDFRSDIGFIRGALRGKMLYSSILDYRWVDECLRKFTRVDIFKFNLEIRGSSSDAIRTRE